MFTIELYRQLLLYFQNIDPFVYNLLLTKGYIGPPEKNRNIYVLLIGSIIGQKISYIQGRKYRSQLFSLLGDNFNPYDIFNANISFLPRDKIIIIINVTQYIINNNITDIWQLINVYGIGSWTIKNTLIMYSLNNDIEYGDYLLNEDYIIKKKLPKIYNQELWSPYNGIISWYLWN